MWKNHRPGGTVRRFFLLIHILLSDSSLEGIIGEQYHLAKLAGISLSESTEMPDFERETYLDLLAADLKREAEAMKPK